MDDAHCTLRIYSLFKPGKENHLADFLSRLNEDNPGIDSYEEDDYHDQLVAAI